MASIVNNVPRIIALGPIKMEVATFTATVDGDTYASRLQRPVFALAFNNGDAGGANGISAAVSGRTVTFHDPDIATVGLIVFGF